MITASVNLDEFDAALYNLAAATGREVQDVVKQQARLLVKDAQKATWPNDPKGFSERTEKEVRARVITPDDKAARIDSVVGSRLRGLDNFLTDKLRDRKLAARVDKLYFADRYDILTKIFRDAESKRYIAADGAVTLAQLRDARKNKKRIVVERQSKVNAVLRLIRNEQFKTKAGWNAAAEALSLPLPGGARKHGKKFGSAEVAESAGQYWVRIINSAPLAGVQEQRTDFTRRLLEDRVDAMKNNTEKALKRAARKAGF